MIKQCEFRDDEGKICYGILCDFDNDDKYIICACCGAIFDPDEVEITEIYDCWVNFSDFIR